MVSDTKRIICSFSSDLDLVKQERRGRQGLLLDGTHPGCLQFRTKASPLVEFNTVLSQLFEKRMWPPPAPEKELAALLASSRAKALISRASLSWAQLYWHLTVPGTPYDASAVWLGFSLILWVSVSSSERKGIEPGPSQHLNLQIY